jgi:hypothetical protein
MRLKEIPNVTGDDLALDKKFADYLSLNGGQLTGNTEIKRDSPYFRLTATGNTNAHLRFQDSNNQETVMLYVEQTGKLHIRFAKTSHAHSFHTSGITQLAGSLGIGSYPAAGLNNGKFIAIGDSDTGMRQNGDGQLQHWANNQLVTLSTSSSHEIYKSTLLKDSRAFLELRSDNSSKNLESTIRFNVASGQGVDLRLNTYDSNRAPFGLHIERAASNGQTGSKAYLEVEGNLHVGDAIWGDGKEAFRLGGSWLRINQSSQFSSGIYTGSSIIRTDAGLQVGGGGNRFKADSSGTVTAYGKMYAQSHGSDIRGSKVLTYDDFLPDVGSPDGVEGIVQGKWLQINGTRDSDGIKSSFKVVPDSNNPIHFARLNSDNEETDVIFSIDQDGDAYLKGKISEDTVDIESIQEEARNQINPYYLGTNSDSTKQLDNPVTQATYSNNATTSGIQLSTVDVLGNRVNLAWKMSISASYDNSNNNQNFSNPKWRVEVRRGSKNGVRVVNRYYEGTSMNVRRGPLGDWYGNSRLLIEDLFSDETSSNTRYHFRAIRVDGTPQDITYKMIRAQSPAYKRIEMELEYTTLYKSPSAGGLGSGNINLSEDMRNFQFISIMGSPDNNYHLETNLLAIADVERDYLASTDNSFLIMGNDSTIYWRVRPNNNWNTLFDRGENCRIRRISGVNIVEK